MKNPLSESCSRVCSGKWTWCWNHVQERFCATPMSNNIKGSLNRLHKMVHIQNPAVLKLYYPRGVNSITYQRFFLFFLLTSVELTGCRKKDDRDITCWLNARLFEAFFSRVCTVKSKGDAGGRRGLVHSCCKKHSIWIIIKKTRAYLIDTATIKNRIIPHPLTHTGRKNTPLMSGVFRKKHITLNRNV